MNLKHHFRREQRSRVLKNIVFLLKLYFENMIYFINLRNFLKIFVHFNKLKLKLY